ncbi:hypothetical protein MOQ_003475 [Trypanosoma cruzi marinkellei]|uniref:Leucine-rich repeat protein (LRRP) n=1 Tax=Trypanosoma cruzi marinkellei TaxID=85056 RepID=K2NCT4_TRYCR|nr:hypothetical protein MOQ_003475 [Trypanosoma cruzi marinkellei]
MVGVSFACFFFNLGINTEAGSDLDLSSLFFCFCFLLPSLNVALVSSLKVMPSGTGNTVEEGTLSEECILRASRQYDVEVLFQISLCSQGLRSLGDGFARCLALVRVDVSRNRLTSLEGIALLAGSLRHINASENEVEDLAGVDRCVLLEEVRLEGNQLSNEAAVLPLAQLPNLRSLFLQREMPLSGDTHETLLLDNPICHDKGMYDKILQRHFASVLCVDGRCFRHPPPREVVAEAAVFSSSTLPLSGTALEKNLDTEDDLDERIFANAVAECRAACRKALL